MERPLLYLRSLVDCFRPATCCYITPVRIGLIATGYFNIAAAVISLLGTANDSFPPTIVKVQQIILDDNATKTAPVLAYATEIAFSMVLLCGMYRKDVVLLRAYLYYCVGAVIMSLLVYSMVIAAIDVLVQIVIIFSTGFQIYVILLLRCTMLVMESSAKNRHLPTIAMSSLSSDDKPTRKKYFLESEKAAETVQTSHKETQSLEEIKYTDINDKSGDEKSTNTVTEQKATDTETEITDKKKKPADTETETIDTQEKKSTDTENATDGQTNSTHSGNIPTDAVQNVEGDSRPKYKTEKTKKKFFGLDKKSVESKKKSLESNKKSTTIDPVDVEKADEVKPGTSIVKTDVTLETVNENTKE